MKRDAAVVHETGWTGCCHRSSPASGGLQMQGTGQDDQGSPFLLSVPGS